MNKKKLCWLCGFVFIQINLLFSQKEIPNLALLDVINYEFQLTISDETDEVEGMATVQIHFLKNQKEFALDLVSKNEEGKGMKVINVTENETTVNFQQVDEKLIIQPTAAIQKDDKRTFTVHYQGIPADGLIIGKSKFGDRTFFGDNWPNRAHHWLPCIDHPSDKAPVAFKITAPDHYQIVANGVQIEEVNLDDERKMTYWKETTPLPMKVAVFGAARFGVQYVGDAHGIPVTSWVYRQNREEGYYDYSMAKDILAFFIDNIGPYSYKKLANVQSKTRYGGMENASNIFYYENSVTGNRKVESLIAHEIAHQWFGNAASEKNWHHVWLSEGFATYGTNLYLEATYGRKRMEESLQSERQAVVAFMNRRPPTPIVNTEIEDNWVQLLNANVYQRGSWVLHMLRRKVGDAAFWKGLRNYYAQYKGKNALTKDFQKVMEMASGQNLNAFFQQWLYRAEIPRMEITWDKPSKKKLRLKIKQVQNDAAFDFPLDIQAIDQNGTSKIWTKRISKKEQEIILKCKFAPEKIILDPNTWLLFTGKVEDKMIRE